MASTLESEPSNYMQTLTRYLSNIMNSTLLGLPREIKELIYFDALSHAANMILVRPSFPSPKLSPLIKSHTGPSPLPIHQENKPQRRRRPRKRRKLPIGLRRHPRQRANPERESRRITTDRPTNADGEPRRVLRCGHAE